MKKIFIPLISFILIIVIIGFILWFNIPNIIARMISKELSVPVSIENVVISKHNLVIENLDVGTPKNSKTKSSFSSKIIDMETSLKHLRGETLTINSLMFQDSIIGIEFYNATGTNNNWATIMSTPTKSKKQTKRKYLIKKLILTNITVVLTKANGQKQTFPTIDRLEFENITDETGFPIDEIEKAIAQAVLRSVFQKFNLLHLFDNIPPVNVIKKIVPLF